MFRYGYTFSFLLYLLSTSKQNISCPIHALFVLPSKAAALKVLPFKATASAKSLTCISTILLSNLFWIAPISFPIGFLL
ncbi:TPA: hypothetical protein I9007_000880 [Clostridium perfringens]|uniref:hypothetical protein n=1 Tax=Clostridium perfringens TaxID=1502 RepID=UPI001A190503|nr:hypothetical protein [Clostridium perfringens]WFB45907.1 hypothetical protein P6X90_05815 [Clostridium perfringens]WFD77476.1 hypothetical protein P6978_05815 [Clostridium perfringens]WFD86032.1 hypothetical protein P7C31_05875 [Clostridium perfringens]WFD98844.1 hypothetical protein P7D00_05870 [Clostridium perfringens]HAT4185393.1 hypothetical protein [Clostridium perfringens]